MTATQILKQYFGYDKFRAGQETLIDSIMAKRDVLGVMPTGAGKSVCFQIPALMTDGVVIVVSPLISLMKDQVSALTQNGINAAFVNSSLTLWEIERTLRNAKSGVFKLIYAAPERLVSGEFLAFARSINVSMLAVDEAHCISQWGQDFRPSYAQIPDFIAKLPARPVVSAFTATATPPVRADIVNLLGMNNPHVLVTGFNRENLRFDVKKPRNKYAALTEFLKRRKTRRGIIYCGTRKTVEEVCGALRADGCNASRYHAGLSDDERRGNQDDFLSDRALIMVATNAFGMGIDKPNVSFVVHYNMPKDIESYYQEAGRAGRDGRPADCLLLYSGQDVVMCEWMIENDRDAQYADGETARTVKERARKRLREMTYYCTTGDCLRGSILKYFGEDPPHYCGNCGNCDANFKTADITVEAQKILSCVARMKERFGSRLITDVLRGCKNEKVTRFGFDKLSTFGICADIPARQLRGMIDFLAASGYLSKSGGEYPIIALGERAEEALRGRASVLMKPVQDAPPKRTGGARKFVIQGKSSKPQGGDTREGLRDRDIREFLREREAREAREAGEARKALEAQKKLEEREALEKNSARKPGRKSGDWTERYIGKLSDEPTDTPIDKSGGGMIIKRTLGSAADAGLFYALRKLRYEISKEQNVPAFTIFKDATLADICEQIPRSREGLLKISGIGQMKLDKYGDRFLAAIDDYFRRTVKS